MGVFESLCNFEKNQKESVYGAYKREQEDAYRDGYRQALDDVRVILGGKSPVDPTLHPERAKAIDEISLAIMQDLYSQVDSIREFMESREYNKLTPPTEKGE